VVRPASAVVQVIDIKRVAQKGRHGETGMRFASDCWLAEAIIV
jgi:hypothetical protein